MQNENNAMAVTRQNATSITAIVMSIVALMISVISTSMTRLRITLVVRSGFIMKKAT